MIRPSQRFFADAQLDQRLSAGLVGHWVGGGGSGLEWPDRSGYRNHATLVGGALWTLGQGGHQHAIEFDGVNGYADIAGGLAMLDGGSELTISYWAYRAAATDNISFEKYNGSTQWFELSMRGDGNMIYLVANTGVTFKYLSGYTDIGWHHHAMTFNGALAGDAKITGYVNGRERTGLITNGTIPATLPSGGVARIGQYSSGAFMKGAMADVRVYNRALSAADIALLAQPSFVPVVSRRWGFPPKPPVELSGVDAATATDTGSLEVIRTFGGVGAATAADTGSLEVASPSAATYAPDAGRQVVLVEVTPSVTVDAWTVHSGSAYKADLARFITAGAVQLYRRVVGVRMNATDLIMDSIANVVAFPGFASWDEAASVLYVRAPGSVDPATLTVQAFVTYHFATEGRVIAPTSGAPDEGIYYRPWLTGNLPRLSRQVSDILFGLTIAEAGDVEFTNGHSAWHTLVPGHNWRNKRARFLLGQYGAAGDELYRDDFVPVATMLIEDLAPDEETCTLKLAPLPRLLDAEVPATPYTRTAYPNLGDGVSGGRKWLGWGRGIVRPDLTDNSVYGTWTVADAAYQTLFAMHEVVAIATSGGARATLTEGVDYSVDLTACTITVLNATYAWSTHLIECDVTGKPNGAGGYLRTFAQIVKDLLTTHVGVAAGDLDLPSFTQADVDAPEELAVWIKEKRSIASLISSAEEGKPSLERSVLGSLRQTLDGKWNVRVWNGATPAAAAVELQKSDFARFKPEPKIESVVSRTRVHYAFDASLEEWSVEESTNLVAQYLSETRDAMDAFTFLTNAADAVILSQRLILLAAAQSTEVEFEERAAKLVATMAGDFALVTFSPAPVLGGAFDGQALEILRLDIALSPTLVVSGRMGDLRSIGDRVGHVTDDTGVAWSAATDEEKAAQGFVSDDDGYIDSMTLNQSLVW